MSDSGVDKSAYDDLPDGVLVADEAGRVVLVNPVAARLLATPADSAVGRDYREVLPLLDEQSRDWWSCTDPYAGMASRTRQPERQLQLGSGPAAGRDLLVTASYVRDDQRRLVRLVVVLRDTVARERLERSRANLVSTVAHELRSPLTSVKGFTATLLAKWERFNDDQKKVMLQTVNADADRVTRLISELLDVSRIDAGRLEMRKQVVDVPAAVRKIVAGRVASGDAEDRFSVVETPGLPEMWVDPDKLQQVVGNLVENALRHGEGHVSITVGPVELSGGTGCEVTVADEGEGIPEATASRVFTRFWRGGDRRGGTGLGLYIVKGLVEAHGGSVEVQRAPSGGALFRFVLPAGTPSFV
ncbi:MAG: PAS domain-containing sensor histidine kinase [Mycobacteriales bacterium]|nr:PAS domain-containing sensor histidine kinase [Mycobacteriales bacterium]